MGARRYDLHGLTVDCCLPCPELAAGDGPADVVVRFGEVPRDLPEAGQRGVLYQAAPGKLRLALAGVAAFLVTDGREIVVAPAPRAEEEAVRVLLLGSVMGALLHQRGLLPLHASAIEVAGRCVAFAGGTADGKSTLAAACHRAGYRVLADDVCAVAIADGGTAVAYPAFPELRLWRDALAELGIAAEGLRPVRPGLEKYRLPVASRPACDPLPLSHVYLLSAAGRGVDLQPLGAASRLDAVVRHTYRRQFLGGFGLTPRYLELAAAVSRQAAVTRVGRPRGAFRLDELARAVAADFAP